MRTAAPILTAAALIVMTFTPAPAAPPQASTPAPSPASALSGPRVAERAPSRPTLVSRDFEGRVRRPETTPEEAAVALIELDPPARAAVGSLFLERSQAVDRFVVENLLLLQEAAGAEASGDKLGQLRILRQGLDRFDQLWTRGPYEGAVRLALPATARPEFDRLIKEYYDAVVAEARTAEARAAADTPAGEPAAKPVKPKGRLGIVIEERLGSLGREAERAFKRQERAGNVVFHVLFHDMTFTPEVSAKLHELCAAYQEETGGNPNKVQETRFGFAVLAELDTAQQVEVIKRVKGMTGPPATPAPTPAPVKKPG